MLSKRTRRHTQLPKVNDHVRALRSWLQAHPDAVPQDRRIARDELENLLDALGRPGEAADADERPDPQLALTLARVLVDAGPPTAELVREHADQFDDVLPTVLLAELARWYVAAALGPVAGSRAVADRVVVALAEEFRRGDDTMRAVIATGFLDMLPRSGELGHDVVHRLPRRLGRELAAMQHT